MNKIFNLGSITLSGSGEVKGVESVLDALTELEIKSVSGALDIGGYLDPFATNNGCTNTSDCADSMNKMCKNTASNCSSGTNSGKCTDK